MLMMNPEVCGPASIFEICAEVGTFLVADERSRCRHRLTWETINEEEKQTQ